MSDLLHALFTWVESFAGSPYGGWALFAIAFAESSIFPVPPDVLLIALCIGDPASSFLFAVICSVGSVLGGVAGYGIGLWGGRPIVRRLVSADRLAAVERYYDRYDAWAVGIAGLTPLPYKLFTVSGGVFAIDFRVFVVASVVSRSCRFFAVATLIYFFGLPVRTFVERYLNLLTIVFVILLALGFWLVKRGAGGAIERDEKGPGGLADANADGRDRDAEPSERVGAMSEERTARRWRITGRVQGVGYRHHTRQAARRLGVDGWVRNEADGSVEVRAAGARAALDRLAEELRRGPRSAVVDDVEEEEHAAAADWDGFSVRY